MSSTLTVRDLGPWSQAAQSLGLDDAALLRVPRARKLSEEAHQIHELRRAAHGRVVELEGLLTEARNQYNQATDAGLRVLKEIHAELERQSSAMQATVAELQKSLEPANASRSTRELMPAETPSAELLIERHDLAAQFDAMLDLLTMQGLYDSRARTVQVRGRDHDKPRSLPPFERVAEVLLTQEVCEYLARVDDLHLVLTPVADVRVIRGIGKIIGFSDFTSITSDDRSGTSNFVNRIATTEGRPVVEALLDKTPIPGLAVGLYPESHSGPLTSGIEGLGLGIDETREQLRTQIADAATAGLIARPMSPPEYMMLQALRHRDGRPLLDEADSGGSGTETWFPAHNLTGAHGTIVSRKLGHSVRFRLDEVGRGAERRGYRMSYAPAAMATAAAA